ncbi:ATP-binding protein [Calidifontibacillus erzurumensis]|uniref:histidine kinase n=1 Tax=Calidifontibacillus erzurumensis TaxID=2741433 RepID=A0A8J8GCM2_9BACI|nr:sensor histidine kinase [Calidifontibacillus erzurumensis]NSL51364.1 sensor histidine kinase [Calidifontibacillus erzurumensis]
MYQKIPLRWKITGLALAIMGFAIIMVGIALIGNLVKVKEEELKERALITARTVAEFSGIRSNINGGPEERKAINPLVERVRIINGATYIVVLDMNRVRLSHPVDSLIGKVSEGADEGPAFAEHTYTTKAKGEAGTSVRAFVPIMNEQHEQIGVVLVGYLLPTIPEIIFSLKFEIITTIIVSIIFGGWGSWILANHIKRQIFQLEPHEIAAMLVERTETFNAMHEGIVAIDNNETITIFNDKAKELLGISGDVIGKKIREVIPDTYLPEILKLKQPIYNKELNVRNKIVLSNRIPIKVNNKTIGAVAVFQDQTEVKKLAEELTGVKAFVNALRVQNHEYLNKLHTIAGLIQMNHKEKALDYVFQITEEHQELTQFLGKSIHDESLAGLLLSKVTRGKELGIQVIIDRNSKLRRFPPPLDHHDFVVIIGNLIENAFESFKEVNQQDKQIFISIEQDDEVTSILVEDNGCGIDEDIKDKLFLQGFTTKGEAGHGIGLYLVNEIVKKANGEIVVESQKGHGTSMIITFYENSAKRRVEDGAANH